jgi:sugar porter (SP) family MFS transporter
VLGSLIGSWPTDRFGRKKTLLWIGVLFLTGSLWSAFAHDVVSFMVARFIGGIAIGISTVAAPLYISEISPPEKRGRLAGMFQFNIVFGILVAFVSNSLLAGMGDQSWRWMLGIMVVPSIIYTSACFFIPESPRWLISRKGDRAGGIAVLKLITPKATAAELEASADAMTSAGKEVASAKGFWRMGMRTPILIAILVAFFNQASGINAILYFAPRIFELTGLGQKAALLQSVGIGVTNLIFTFVGLWLIDRLGRRTLRWGYAPGRFSPNILRSSPRASLPSSPRTRSVRAR